jgi:hypothetical protein
LGSFNVKFRIISSNVFKYFDICHNLVTEGFMRFCSYTYLEK